jgi:hypothetical protein
MFHSLCCSCVVTLFFIEPSSNFSSLSLFFSRLTFCSCIFSARLLRSNPSKKNIFDNSVAVAEAPPIQFKDLPPAMQVSRLVSSRILLAQAIVSESTRHTYSCGWKHWVHFCSMVRVNEFLLSPLPPVVHRKSMVEVNIPPQCSFLRLFTTYLFNLNLHCDTIINYCSAVRHYFREKNFDLSIFEHPSVSSFRTAMINQFWRSNPTRHSYKLPFSWVLIKHCFDPSIDDGSSLSKSINFAIVLAYHLFLRGSEFLPRHKKGTNHFLKASGFYFHFGTSVVPVHSWQTDILRLRHQHQIWPSAMGGIIPSSKTDQHGVGFKFFFPAEAFASLPDSLNLIRLALLYCVRHQLSVRDPLFPFLRGSLIAHRMKRVARHFQLDQSRVSLHCLRVAAATALYAAGVQDSCILRFGRWAPGSTAVFRYLRTVVVQFSSAVVALESDTLATVNDIRLLH